MSSFTDAIQSVLTQGIDAAKSIAVTKLQVNNPVGDVVGPNGSKAQVGQGAYGVALSLSAIPPAVYIAAAGLIVYLILRK